MTHDPYYETMYILRPDIPEEEVESHLTKYRDMLVEAGADVLDNQMRGKRRLAYPCLLYTSPSPRDGLLSRMPSSA